MKTGTLTGSGARSLNVADINKITGYTVDSVTDTDLTIYRPTTSTSTGISESAKKGLDIQNGYEYRASNYLDTTSVMYKMLFKDATDTTDSTYIKYFLASRDVDITSQSGYRRTFAVNSVNSVYGSNGYVAANGYLGSQYYLFQADTDGNYVEGTRSLGVRHIVYLKTTTQTTGKDSSGAWIIKDSLTEPTTWTDITSTTSEINIATRISGNGTVYFWTKNALGYVNCASYTVSKIDKVSPYLTQTVTFTPGSSYIKVHIPASDNNVNAYFANSGIKTYGVCYQGYGIGSHWVYSSSDTFNITGLSPSTTYYIKSIKLIDNAGNENQVDYSNAIEVTTTSGYY